MAKQNNGSKSLWETDDNSLLEPPAPYVKFHDPSNEDKSVFFGILKHLLQVPYTLRDGMWDEKEQNGKVFKLIFGRKGCKVSFECKGNRTNIVVAALDIYLHWRGNYQEILSLENLQTVQNELKALGVQDERIHACFSLVKHSFVQESLNVQHITLTILDEIILTFGPPKQKMMIVMYDEKESRAVYYIQSPDNAQGI